MIMYIYKLSIQGWHWTCLWCNYLCWWDCPSAANSWTKKLLPLKLFGY